MEKDQVEFKLLDSKLVGNNTVVFRLEDGTVVKIKVDIRRAGVAIKFKNPDGTPHYAIDTNLGIEVVPKSKKFYIPKSRLRVPPPPKESKMKPI
ncbi:hypothetical protein ES707_15853 [subsurface metagenome]